MDIQGFEELKLTDLREVFECNNLSMKEAMPRLREFRDKHGFDDKTTLRAFGVAKRVFEA